MYGEDTSTLVSNVKADKQTYKRAEKLQNHAIARPFNFTRDVNKSHFLCPACQCPFLTKQKRDEHAKCHKKLKKFICKHCLKPYSNIKDKSLHERKCTPTSQIGGGQVRQDTSDDDSDDGDLEVHESALKNILNSYRLSFSRSSKHLADRLQAALQQVYERVILQKENDQPFKVYGSLQASFYKAANPDEVMDPAATDVQEIVKSFYSNLLHQVDDYERSGSGWILHNLVYLDLHILKFNPLRGSPYVEMLKKFTKGFVNIVNEDKSALHGQYSRICIPLIKMMNEYQIICLMRMN